SKQQAGRDWFYGWKEQNPEPTLRTPEATSLARAAAFNCHNINSFFDQYESILHRPGFKLEANRLWNLDETGIQTVQNTTGRFLSEKCLKQVGQVTSGERGVLVTMCCCVNAARNALPPAYIFPRVHYRNHMLNGAPTGNCSFWMDEL
ncbi:hypothetical protein CAPTEDRAFT_125523, partial [Capitella teleta]